MHDGRTLDLVERLVAFDTATLYEATGQRGAMLPGIRPLSGDCRIAGRAFTVLTEQGDNLALHAAVAAVSPGEVIVAQCHDTHVGCWGEVLTVAAIARSVAGVIIDGAVRDIEALRDLEFPVFARGTALSAATKLRPGHLQLPIACGGTIVRPGDYVVADASGVVVVESDVAEATLAAAIDRADKEVALMEQLRDGATTIELLGLEGALERRADGAAASS